jgi:hypothetical protein
VPVAHACNLSSSGIWFKASKGNTSVRPYLEKSFTTIGVVECLKVRALSSSPSIVKKKYFLESCQNGKQKLS